MCWCGMIVGFDHDDASAFDAIADFIAEARIANALIGMLHAIPTTPLYDRLKQDGRLNDAEATDRYGTNVIPLGMSRELSSARLHRADASAYTTDAYFARLDALFIDAKFDVVLYQLHCIGDAIGLPWRHSFLRDYVKFIVISIALAPAT